MSMDVSYVNPFIASTINAFKTMLSTDIRAGTPSVKKHPYPTYDVSGIIGLSGNAQGVVAVSFPKVVALKVVSALLGTPVKVVGPELTDGIGELSNIIAGSAKKDLTQHNVAISLPNVIIGKNHMLTSPKGTPTILVPFTSSIGDFALEVSLKTSG